jgi:uncharacterized protein YndB with AHSA1/START domain
MTIAPVKKRVSVPLSAEDAFTLFTAGIAGWWPVDTHSLFGKAARPFFEPVAGGRVGERDASGRDETWGTIRVCERPARLVYGWHPGRDPSTAQELEVRFVAEGTVTTVELEHRGWDVLGERALESREDYDTGWDRVLGRYTAAARKPAPASR